MFVVVFVVVIWLVCWFDEVLGWEGPASGSYASAPESQAGWGADCTAEWCRLLVLAMRWALSCLKWSIKSRFDQLGPEPEPERRNGMIDCDLSEPESNRVS